jgi:peptide/nickel transport system permease protein
VLQLVPTLFLVSVATFAMIDLLPGDPAVAILGETATPAQITAVRHDLGLDKPLVNRYVHWASHAVRGDLGKSVKTGQPVVEAFRQRLPVTLELAIGAELFALVCAVPLGIWQAHRAGRAFDRAASAASLSFLAVPPFVLAILLVYFVSLRWNLLPPSGFTRISSNVGDNLRRAILPILTLGLVELAVYAQVVRSEMVSTLKQDYILAARSRGLPTRHILWREALRPSSFPLITLAGVNLGRLLGGTVIVETYFALGGVGKLLVESITEKDMPMLQGSVLILTTAFLVINLLIDVSYSLIDPRVRQKHA